MVTDDILYRRYLGGDEDSLSALMERHGDKLTLYLDGCLHDLHESEDLMIEAFAYLIAKQPRIRDGGFRAYLYRSARHMALRLLSRKRAQLCFSLDTLTEEPEARELVEEARRVARNYAGGDHGRFSRIWRDLSPAVYTLMGAAGIGLVWLTVWLI